MTGKTQSLMPHVLEVVGNKGTEHPFTGEYDTWDKPGTFLCRQCGIALFISHSKFHSGCGWPSFDQEIKGAVLTQSDVDGRRSEIVCSRCQAHLGHVFHGEQFTDKNTRHCVNSLSLDYVEELNITDTEEALFACGCFWGVEFYFKKLNGVLKTEVGYSGGHTDYPSYQQVCSGSTGHVETIRVIYDPQKLSYEKLAQYFFEIHDPIQSNGQGPDIGSQYLSVIFYYDKNQKNTAEKLIKILEEKYNKDKSYTISTKILPVSIFWPAEIYHQDYYQKTGKSPYCHVYTKKF